jgi:anti-sigma B factor antagonist
MRTARGARAGGVLVIDVTGEVDALNVDSLGEQLRERVRLAPDLARIVMDCSSLTFIDSRGLLLFAQIQADADTADKLLTWRNLSPVTRSLVHLLALDRVMKIEAA